MHLPIFGVDFSSSPSRRKPIVVASASLHATAQTGSASHGLRLDGFERLETLEAFSAWLQRAGPWVGGFDFPFALPRAFLQAALWPPFQGDAQAAAPWPEHVRHVATLARTDLVAAFRAYCNARPPGAKFAHRPCDEPAGASPSMKWVNPPVAFMMHAGAPRLLQAGLSLPGLQAGDPQRVALEAYPGYLARLVLARRSYKSDDRRKQDAARLQAREDLLAALERHSLQEIGLQRPDEPSLMLECTAAARAWCRDDPSGDALDAWLCAIQAAVGVLRQQADPGSQYGMAPVDPLEGWIVSVPRPL